jgi:hypothetical protein
MFKLTRGSTSPLHLAMRMQQKTATSLPSE